MKASEIPLAPVAPRRSKPRKIVDGQIFCVDCQSWQDLDNYGYSASRTFNKAPYCKPCNKIRNLVKTAAAQKVKDDERARIEASTVLIYAIPYKQNPLSNYMACNIWDSSLDFEELTA